MVVEEVGVQTTNVVYKNDKTIRTKSREEAAMFMFLVSEGVFDFFLALPFQVNQKINLQDAIALTAARQRVLEQHLRLPARRGAEGRSTPGARRQRECR